MTIRNSAESVLRRVDEVMVGKRQVAEQVLIAVLSDGHVLLEDVPGIGKTTLAKAMAAALGCSFARIQFTPDLLPSDVSGISFFNQRAQEFEYRAGPVMSQILLADEINRAAPRTQSALLEAMQERQVTVDGITHPLPLPFLVLATQNPIELEGTFPLPEAQIDRFIMQVRIGYPEETAENDMLLRFQRDNPLDGLEPAISGVELLEMQQAVRSIRVEESVRQYLVSVVRATREHPAVDLGVSPRGTLALFRTCQALAAIRGRDYVLPDDVKELAPSVLTHRIHINPQTRLRGRTPQQVVDEIVDEVAVPVTS